MRISAYTWPFAFGVKLGWATCRTPNPSLTVARARVFLLRGNGMIFGRGFGAICDRLRRAGLWAEDLRCVGDRWIRQLLLADRRAECLSGPIILVGHSCGGRYALFTAQALAQYGITVELIVVIDVAAPFPVASNVRHAIHVYRSQRRIYRARPLRTAPGSSAQITNLDLDAADSPIRPDGLHHLNFTTAPSVKSWVVERILQAVTATRMRQEIPKGQETHDYLA